MGFDPRVELLVPHQRSAPPIPVLPFSRAGPDVFWELVQPRQCGDERLALNQSLHLPIGVDPPVGPNPNKRQRDRRSQGSEEDAPAAESRFDQRRQNDKPLRHLLGEPDPFYSSTLL